MKRRNREPEDTGSWMNTYSDLVTLLMTFFVLLYSFSSVDSEKWEAFVKAFGTPGDATSQVVLGVENPDPGANSPVPDGSTAAEGNPGSEDLPQDFDQLYQYLEQYVQDSGNAGSIEVMKSGDSVVYIRFQDDIFFDSDEYYLRQSAYSVLDVIGDAIHNVEDEIYIISINGHTAQVDDPNYAVSDWMLSSERASSVAIYFEEEKQIDPQKMRPMGYGKNYPIASNDTPEGRQKNRRVDMAIVKNSEEVVAGDMEQVLHSLFDPTSFPTAGGVSDLFTPEGSISSSQTEPETAQSSGEGV
mgnify:FL=1